MHDVQVNIDGVKVDDITPKRLGSVYRGEQVLGLVTDYTSVVVLRRSVQEIRGRPPQRESSANRTCRRETARNSRLQATVSINNSRCSTPASGPALATTAIVIPAMEAVVAVAARSASGACCCYCHCCLAWAGSARVELVLQSNRGGLGRPGHYRLVVCVGIARPVGLLRLVRGAQRLACRWPG